MKFKFLTLIGLMMFAFSSFGFDASLNYYGTDAAKVKAMGCGCDSQVEVDAFLSEYYKRVAREVQKRNNSIPAGVINAGTTNVQGFFGSFTENISTWLQAGDIKQYDRVIIFVNWPEYNN